MQHTKLLVAALACAAAPAMAQHSALQLYGRLNVAAEKVRSDSVDSTRLSNNRSVFGLRGTEALGDGLALIFQIEGTVSPDSGAGAIASRDTRIGLQGKAGTLFAGNWTTPYNSATSGLDPFYPTTAGYMSIMGNGAGSTVSNVDEPGSFDRRQQNSIQYWSPTWKSLSLRLAHGFNEERPANGAKPSLHSAALVFDNSGPVYATLAHERHQDYQGPGLDDHASKAALALTLGSTRVALIGERLSYADGALRRNAMYVSVSHQIDAVGIRFSLGRAGDGRGQAGRRIGFVVAAPDSGAIHATLGYEYALSKRTTAYLYHTRIDNDTNGVTGFAINSVPLTAGATVSGTALGMRHAF